MQHFVSGATLAEELEEAHQFFASMLAPLTLVEFQEHFFEKEALLVACQHQNNDQGNHFCGHLAPQDFISSSSSLKANSN